MEYAVRELKVFDNRSEREGRRIGKTADDKDHTEGKQTKSGWSVGRVLGDCGTIRCAASDPAMAKTGTITKKRPTNMASARVRL